MNKLLDRLSLPFLALGIMLMVLGVAVVGFLAELSYSVSRALGTPFFTSLCLGSGALLLFIGIIMSFFRLVSRYTAMKVMSYATNHEADQQGAANSGAVSDSVNHANTSGPAT